MIGVATRPLEHDNSEDDRREPAGAEPPMNATVGLRARCRPGEIATGTIRGRSSG